MQAQIEKLIEDIKTDYENWMTRLGTKPDFNADFNANQIQAFKDGVTYNAGKKYIKILKRLGSQTMVWGFVVNVDDDAKFRKGDLLMAAGFNAPARNKPRGNILDGDYTIRWTGPEYLK